MNKLPSILFGAVLLNAGSAVVAADDVMRGNGMMMGMDMKMMDTNNDRVISRDEFMKHHEAMYDRMKKNKSGMVDMKEMGMMHGRMMEGCDMMKGGGMMNGDRMRDSAKK